MKRICLSVVGMILTLFSAFGQSPEDSTQYKSRKLSFEEANLVTSYYTQNGNNSAVTGGIGTEKLTDYSGAIDIKLSKWDKKDRKHTFIGEVGLDHYTSASSDKINPQTITSASYSDTRFYPSFNWTVENLKKGTTVGAGASFSAEFDYTSIGANLNFSKKTNNRNGEFTAKAQAFIDRVSLIYPIELRVNTGGGGGNREEENNYASTPRNSFNGSLSWSQIVNQRLQVMFIAEMIYQKGYLGLPFHRVYFTNNSVHVENLPDTRMKIPLGFRASYFLGDRVILKAFYRYYHDDWGLGAHTIDVEAPVKITAFLSIAPFYRFYKQTAVNYFAPYKMHTSADQYYTSNYDLSSFTSNFYGAGFRITPPRGVFGIQRLGMLELRYGHYTKNYGMNANIISMNLKFK